MFRIVRRFLWAMFGVPPAAGTVAGRLKNGRTLGLSMMPLIPCSTFMVAIAILYSNRQKKAMPAGRLF
jgi:hypothetical protein